MNYIEREQISLFSKHLRWLDWKQMAETINKLGFGGVDLEVRPDGHVLPEKVEEDLPKVFEICKKADVEITMICTNIGDVSNPTTEKILKIASRLGIKSYRTGWLFYDRGKTLNENLNDIKEKMKNLAEVNEYYGIKGSYQNHNGNWFGSPVWDLGIVLQDIDSPWLGCQYDILNATIEAAESWSLGMEYIVPYIHSFDVKDAKWIWENGKQKLKYVPLGEGMVNFARFLKLTEDFNVNVPISLHAEYFLGGAEIGMNNITTPAEKVLNALEKDLSTIVKISKTGNSLPVHLS